MKALSVTRSESVFLMVGFLKPPRFRSAFFRLAAGLALLLTVGGAAAHAQGFAPHIGFVYPAGGQQGTTFEVTVGGQHLVRPTEAIVSGTGVRAVVIPSEPLLSGKQAADARDRLKELRNQKDVAAREEILKIREKLAAHERAKITPAIGVRVIVRVTIAADAAPGNRELRLFTATGLTNPLLFQVGKIPECREPEQEQDGNWMRIQKSINDPDIRVKPERNNVPPMTVTLPTVINGRILPGEADRFRFKARAGQRLLVAVSARELLPYLADTVPGWLQAAVTLSAPDGKEVAHGDDVQIQPDPVSCYDIPADGEYTLEIRDNIYRGRDDFVYRVRVGDVSQMPGDPPPVATLPPDGAAEREPNNTLENAQPVTLPAVINGCIGEPGDVDVFRFKGNAGARVVAEVYARRLGSPLDSMLIITDAAGNQIGFNDDHEDKGTGLNTHHADSRLAVTLPATGVYLVHIGDIQQNGGKAFSYRLRISPPQPDFALRVVPSTLNIRANATQPVTVHALRRDGFDGEIALALKNAPDGFQLAGGRIPAGQDNVQCTLTASALPGKTSVAKLALEGRAVIGGREVVRAAVPAQQMTQAFSYQHLVPSDDWLVHVAEKLAPVSPAKMLDATPIKIPLQGTAQVAFSAPRYLPFDADKIQLLDPPEGITLKEFSMAAGRVTLTLEADAANVKPGLAGNLIATFLTSDKTPPGAPGKNPVRVPLGSLPAIPYEIRGDKKP